MVAEACEVLDAAHVGVGAPVGGLRGLEVRALHVVGGRVLVDLLLRHDAGGAERGVAVVGRARELELRLGLRDPRLGLLRRRAGLAELLVDVGEVELDEDLALLHLGADVDVPLADVAVRARVDGPSPGEAARCRAATAARSLVARLRHARPARAALDRRPVCSSLASAARCAGARDDRRRRRSAADDDARRPPDVTTSARFGRAGAARGRRPPPRRDRRRVRADRTVRMQIRVMSAALLRARYDARRLLPPRAVDDRDEEERRRTSPRASPPMTARPSGAFCSPPSPSPSDMGSMPRIIASAVISTGRRRVMPASERGAARVVARPCADRWRT